MAIYRDLALADVSAEYQEAMRDFPVRLKKLKRILLRPDSPAIFTEWENLVTRHQVTGKQTHDARLVAAMKAYAISHILTFNTDDFFAVHRHHSRLASNRHLG